MKLTNFTGIKLFKANFVPFPLGSFSASLISYRFLSGPFSVDRRSTRRSEVATLFTTTSIACRQMNFAERSRSSENIVLILSHVAVIIGALFHFGSIFRSTYSVPQLSLYHFVSGSLIFYWFVSIPITSCSNTPGLKYPC